MENTGEKKKIIKVQSVATMVSNPTPIQAVQTNTTAGQILREGI